jgi:hypothetical protein
MADMESVIAQYRDGAVRAIDEIVAQLEGLDPAQANAKPDAPDTNSLWVIAVHTVSSIEQNVLQHICGQDIPRDRDSEFIAEASSASELDELRRRWEDVRQRVSDGLATVSAEDAARIRQHPVYGSVDAYGVLMEVLFHAANHAGEATLTRRLVAG